MSVHPTRRTKKLDPLGPLTFPSTIITSDDYPRAFRHLPPSFKDNIMAKYGYLGEYLFSLWFPGAARNNTPHHDFIFEGRLWDVKTTILREEPKPSSRLYLSDRCFSQECDFYAHVGIAKGAKWACLLGYSDKTLWDRQAKFRKEPGTLHKYSGSLKFSQLYSFIDPRSPFPYPEPARLGLVP